MPRLVSILSSLPDYHEIVVNCARKSEVSLWKYLFSVVGDPLDLFDECMRDEKYECATSYLVILYTMEPSAVSAKESVRLLEATLKSEKYQVNHFQCKLM